MQEKKFIQKGARKVEIDEYLEEELEGAGYASSEIVRTPTSTKIVINAQRPGLVIGRGGSRIRELTQTMEEKFDFENPQIEVNEIEEPDADAEIVAKSIASWIEKDGHPKRVGYTYIRRMKEAGVIGAEIEVSGKLSGNRGRTEKFSYGYVKRCGNTSKDNVDSAYTLARTKPGAIGIKVRIMKEMPEFKHRDVDVNEEILHQTLEEQEAEEKVEKAEQINKIIAEAENMTSAELQRAIEEHTTEQTDITTDEVRTAFENDEYEEIELDEEEIEEAEEELEEEIEEIEEEAVEAEEAVEELEEEIEHDEIVDTTVKEAKEKIRELEEDLEELPVEQIIEAEEKGKSRKTLLKWLKRRKE